jgi:hypothetical protein
MSGLIHFELKDLSSYRTQLMGVAAIMIIACHAAASNVLMPIWMKTLLSLGNYGVEIFLLLSGLGCSYSLSKSNGGYISFWKRRLYRIYIPYLFIFFPYCIVLFFLGVYSISDCLLSCSALEYWIYHRGAWFVSLILPLYFFSPYINKLLANRNKWLYVAVLVSITTFICNIPVQNTVLNNIQWAFGRSPSFVLGMAIADGCRKGTRIHFLWIVLLAVFYVPLHKLLGWNNVEWTVIPLVIYVVTIFTRWLCRSDLFNKCFVFIGKVSLESYLMNIALNSLLILLIPSYFSSSIFYGRYLEYSIVIVFGTLLAYFVNKQAQRLLKLNITK